MDSLCRTDLHYKYRITLQLQGDITSYRRRESTSKILLPNGEMSDNDQPKSTEPSQPQHLCTKEHVLQRFTKTTNVLTIRKACRVHRGRLACILPAFLTAHSLYQAVNKFASENVHNLSSKQIGQISKVGQILSQHGVHFHLCNADANRTVSNGESLRFLTTCMQNLRN